MNKNENNKIYAVLGPTASGKTELALELANIINGEIISCDSMQIYKHLSVGTAKPSLEEIGSIKYHLIDFIELSDCFSAADYSRQAIQLMSEIISYGKHPIFCGGTGLYFDSVFMYNIPDQKENSDIRKKLELNPYESNIDLLKSIDPETFYKIDLKNKKRVNRALEIYFLNGVPKSNFEYASKCDTLINDVNIIILTSKNKEFLYNRINKRVDMMVENGLLEEARLVFQQKSVGTVKQAIGYKEFNDYFNGLSSLKETVEKIKKNTRNYAKRQITWFKKYTNALFIDIEKYNKTKDIVNLLLNLGFI